MNPYDLICNLDEQIINLKAELTYWRETAIYWRDKCEETEIELNKTLDN